MKHVATRVLFAYWDGLRGERIAPERSEVEPGAIRHILADTFILDLKEPGSAVFRLCGTRACALLGGEQKGRDFAALWPRLADHDMSRLVENLSIDSAGVIAGVTGRSQRGAGIELELLMLPLSHRGRQNQRLIGTLSPAAIPHWLGFDPVVELAMHSVRIIWPSGRPGDRPTSEDPPHFIVHQGGRF